MIKINMVGGGFQHDICSSALNKNKYVEWVKDLSSNISIHIDNSILQPTDNNKLNFGWLAESSAVIPDVINKVLNNLPSYKEKYKHIFTHDKRILDVDSEFFKFAPVNYLPWIRNKKIYDKKKLCSIIISNKNFTSGHKFRLDVLNNLDLAKVDHFGRGFINELPWTFEENGIEESGKLIALKDYHFSFAFENDNYDYIFCEKVTDCFATGTIPIFWGSNKISEFFDPDGIIFFDDGFKMDYLTPEFYQSKIKSIRTNFELCLELDSSEDYIYLNYIK